MSVSFAGSVEIVPVVKFTFSICKLFIASVIFWFNSVLALLIELSIEPLISDLVLLIVLFNSILALFI